MNQTIRSRTIQRYTPYSSHIRASAGSKSGNGKSILARRMILQSAVCILFVFFCILCLGSTSELSRDIISEVRTRVVEQNITSEDIIQSLTNTYQECVQYIQGSD